MLREIHNTRQIDGELPRRWFMSNDMDLVIWCDNNGSIAAFQLAYNKSRMEHALTWKSDSGYRHHRVDNGEDRSGKHKSAPLLDPDSNFITAVVADQFKKVAAEIDNTVADFIYEKLLQFPGA